MSILSSRNVICFMLLSLSVSAFTVGCAKRAPLNSALIVLPGAKDVKQIKQSSTDQVIYTLEEKYPAKNALDEISDTLAKQGWKPIKESFLNPGLPSSHVDGWGGFIDSSKSGGIPGGTEYKIRQWLAEWTNTRGDVVAYCLRYRWPANGKANTENLEIAASFFPAQAARQMKQLVTDEMRKQKQ